MTMDDPGWGGYVPPSEAPPSPARPLPPRPPETALPSAATVRQQQVAKAGAWLSVPKNKKIAIGAAVVVVILIIGAAAGLGTSGGGLSKADYIARADAICTSFIPQLQSAESAGNESQLVSVAQSELVQLRALGLPNQDPQDVTAWLNDEQAALSALQQGSQAQFNVNVAKGSSVAAAYGLASCAG